MLVLLAEREINMKIRVKSHPVEEEVTMKAVIVVIQSAETEVSLSVDQEDSQKGEPEVSQNAGPEVTMKVVTEDPVEAMERDNLLNMTKAHPSKVSEVAVGGYGERQPPQYD